MRRLLEKYETKMVRAGLALPGAALFGGRDDVVEWNRDDPLRGSMEQLFDRLSISSLLLCRPAEPYWSMIGILAGESDGVIRPSDCETLTFLHDIPVAPGADPEGIALLLGRRKCAVVPDLGVMTQGSVSPEQAYIHFSSVCFSCFVKFLGDHLRMLESGSDPGDARRNVLEAVRAMPDAYPDCDPGLSHGPFRDERAVRRAISEVGAATVRCGLVDSFFGNVSWLLDGALYISQTTSSLDELDGAVDACPLNGSSCASITASSEYSAHVGVLSRTGADGILHGHPRFGVTMSMACGRPDCSLRGGCHLRCPERRSVCGVPVVTGEVGTGPTGLCNTLPGAIADTGSALVHGHGLFALAREDFRGAFRTMRATEAMCRAEYFRRIDLLSHRA